MHATHAETEHEVRIRQMRWEADRVVSLDLEAVDGEPLPGWTPGAHLDLLLPGVITRQYSLCGDPDERGYWRIAVLHEEVSKGGSQAVHTQLRPGDRVRVVGPRNNFDFVEATRYIFIAGGIGITPILPMIRAAEERGAGWRLVYGGRSRTSMAFVADLVRMYGDRIDVVPQDERGIIDLPSLLAEPVDGTLIYCCGPEPLLAAVEEQTKARWPAGSLHLERFRPKPQSAVGGGVEQPFELVLKRSEQVLTVEPGQSVLEAMEVSGLEPDNSCREGICGTCETVVLEGLPDHRDSLLSDEERAANETMMICVGRCLGERLVLDA